LAKAQAKPTGAGSQKNAPQRRALHRSSQWYGDGFHISSLRKNPTWLSSPRVEILSTPLVYRIESKINAATLSQAFT
jgi:hypothetical protein